MRSAEFTATTKSALRAMIERETIRTGSRCVAHEIVAQTIGASSSWIRKFLAYDGAVGEPRITLFQNIRAAYNQLCERVEADNRTDEVRLRALRGRVNEAAEGIRTQSVDQNSTRLGMDEG